MYEIQFHPANIRKQVRYYFLSRRGFRWLVTATFAVAALLAVGAALTPLGVQSLLLTGELRVMGQQNRLQREILTQRMASLERLDRGVERARMRQQQIALILGSEQTSRGLGGFPDPVPLDVSVPEARFALEHSMKLRTEAKALLALADELASFAQDHDELTRTVPSICPVPLGSFVLTSPFGERISPFTNNRDFHAGIDLAAREGTPVIAAGAGRVVFAGRFPLNRSVRWWRYGNVVVLVHGERYVTIYAHLAEVSTSRGAQVRRGEPIGTVGNTGWSTSPHLHYEVRVMNDDESEPVPVDPRIYILDYQWKGHEAILVAGRRAPAPAFDPLPSRVKVR
jgi:murein DD-endopeptidase MepM/ murein hydrolase activator NlpD